MVDCQVRTEDVTDHELLTALLQVPRESFVPEQLREFAYVDQELSLASIGGDGRALMPPANFAKLAQLAEVNENDFILVLGSGCGYSSAVFSLLGSSVIALEQSPSLVKTSSEVLMETGYENVVVVEGELSQGYEKEAPFDLIFCEGSVSSVPDSLFDQLSDNGGRLVSVIGDGNSAIATVFKKSEGLIAQVNVMNCSVAPIPGFEKQADFVF